MDDKAIVELYFARSENAISETAVGSGRLSALQSLNNRIMPIIIMGKYLFILVGFCFDSESVNYSAFFRVLLPEEGVIRKPNTPPIIMLPHGVLVIGQVPELQPIK